jgi:hypothetical protein
VTMTADPGALLAPAALSSFDVHLQSVPPPLGEASLQSALGEVRSAAVALQVVLANDTRLDVGVRALALRAVADLVANPHAPTAWDAAVSGAAAIAPSDDRAAASARALVERGRAVVASRTADTLTTAAHALRALAADLR